MWNHKLAIFINTLIKKSRSPLLSNMIIVGMVSLLVKVLSFYKEILIAKEYGVNELLDTFLIAVLIPSFIQNVFINSYSSVFIPNYILEKKRSKDTRGFQTSSLIITLSIGILMIVVTYVGIDYYLEYLFPGHKASYYELVKIQLWIILPSMLFWAISALISGLLKVDDEFFFSSLDAIFIPLSTIICLLGFHEQLQERTLALGMLTGSIASTLYLVIVGFRKKLLRLGAPNFRSSNMRVLLKQIPSKISSGLINGVNPMVDQFFSAQLAIGAIAALNYGFKIPMVIIGLIGGPIGSVILPHFSKMAAESSKEAYRHLNKMLNSAFLTMSGIAIIMILASKLIITLFFERGAFTDKETDVVYVIQQMYLIQLPFYVMGIIMNNYLTAINRNNFLVLASVISLCLNIFLNYALLGILGINGLALATSIVSLTNTLVIYLYIKRLNKKESDV